VNGDQFTVDFECYTWRIFLIGKPAERGIQVWYSFAHILIQMGKTVQRFKAWVALCPKNFFGIGFE
jgi:hypothetical protein